MKRHTNAQSSDSWKQVDQEESSISTSTRRLVRAATPRTAFQNVKYTNHQYMTKIFQFLAGYSTFSMEVLKTNVLTWRMFMSSSMKAAIHLGPNYLANLEVYKNTEHKLRGNSELIRYHTEIDIRAFWRNSECEYDWQCIPLMDEISIVPRSSDAMDKPKSTCPLRFQSMHRKDK